MMIQKDILIEDLLNEIPEAVRYLMDRGINPLACGEPVWGTLQSVAKEAGFDDIQIDKMTADLETLRVARQKERASTERIDS